MPSMLVEEGSTQQASPVILSPIHCFKEALSQHCHVLHMRI